LKKKPGKPPPLPDGAAPNGDDDLSRTLKKIRRIELKTRGLVRESFGGEYHSCFKGEGIDFEDFREYQHGDEVRAIDWHVTARLGTPYIKKFSEERELTVFLAVDISASGDYGSVEMSKREMAAEIAALLAFSALQNKDKVGLILFTDEVEMYIPPKKGASHILRLIREILCAQPKQPHTDPTGALELLVRSSARRSLVFLISDFLCNEDFSAGLKPASIKHDLVGIQITDPNELALPRAGRVVFTDAESGRQVEVDTSSRTFQRRYLTAMSEHQQKLDDMFRRLTVDKIDLRTDSDYLPALHAFFQTRERAHA
jgi:uncharacterized protein (DUF58 family)